jgi:hypothetical protein
MGRLALVEKSEIDEMFEPFFDVLSPLAKDPNLKLIFYRSFILLGTKSLAMNEKAILFAEELKDIDSEDGRNLADMILSELKSDYVQESFVKNT